MNFEMVLGFLRHALTFVGGWVVAKGVMDEAMMAEVIGGIMTLLGVMWSVYQKYSAKVE